MGRTTSAPDPLSQRPPGRAVLRLGLPLALGMASHALINVVDLLLVGRLGRDAILAAHVATTINFVPMLLGNGVAIALLSQLARGIGAGELASARQLHRRAEWFMVVFAAVVAVATALPAAPCVDTIGLPDSARADAIHYLVVINLGCVPMFLLMQTTAAMRAVGEGWMPLFLLLLANLLNLALDLLLMFGCEPLAVPAFGVLGAAYATVLARVVAAALAYGWLLRRSHPLSLRADPGAPSTPRSVAVAWPLLRDALPQVLQIALRAIVVWGLTVVAQRRAGADATTAIGITTRLDTMVLFAAVGFGNAATALVGRAIGQGDHRRARRLGTWAGVHAALFGALLVLLFQGLADPLVRVFLPDPDPPIVAAAVLYLGTAAWCHPLSSFALGAIGALHGAGRMGRALLVDLIGYAGLFACGIGAALWADGLLPVYRALIVGSAVAAALHGGYLWLGRWTEPVGAPGRWS